MPSSDKMVRAQVIRLARKGKLVDECFKVFQRTVFPSAPPDVVHGMRTCFFAGAAEIYALLITTLDGGIEPTDGDVDFMSLWVDEVTRFHENTIAATKAEGKFDA